MTGHSEVQQGEQHRTKHRGTEHTEETLKTGKKGKGKNGKTCF